MINFEGKKQNIEAYVGHTTSLAAWPIRLQHADFLRALKRKAKKEKKDPKKAEKSPSLGYPSNGSLFIIPCRQVDHVDAAPTLKIKGARHTNSLAPKNKYKSS